MRKYYKELNVTTESMGSQAVANYRVKFKLKHTYCLGFHWQQLSFVLLHAM